MNNRKITFAVLVIFCLALLTISADVSPVNPSKSYQAERYDVTIVVQPDGALLVTETVVFQFVDGPFTYVFRELEAHNLDDIVDLQASLDGQALPAGEQPGQVEISTGDPIKVTWHFDPTSDSTHEFTLSYRVLGAFRQGTEADTLIWRVIPAEHEYEIARSSIRLENPPGLLPLETPTLDGVAAEFESGERATVFVTQSIDEDEPVDLTVRYPAGRLLSGPPAWQQVKAEEDRRVALALPFGVGAALLAGALGLIGVALTAQGFRRENPAAYAAIQTQAIPPKDIPPALAVRLTGGSLAYLGTLFDLARRGILRIEEGPKQWGSRTFTVIRQPIQQRLAAHEQIFLEVLFRKAKDDRVSLAEIASLAYDGRYGQALEHEIVAAGWRDSERSARRSRFLALSGLGWLLSGGVLLAGFLLAVFVTQDWASIGAGVLIGASLGWGGSSVIGLVVAALISTLSDEGVRQADAWNRFSGYLHNAARGRETVTPDLFERYLPYAAGFGIASEWAKFFQKMTGVPVPAWFQGLQGGMEDGSFIAIMAAITAADSTAASASGADGGASGGGASGAG
jgi:hypothetical protein